MNNCFLYKKKETCLLNSSIYKRKNLLRWVGILKLTNKFLDLLAMWSLGYLTLEKNPHSKHDSHFLLGRPNVTADLFEDISFKLLWTLVKIALFLCSMLPTSHIFTQFLSTFNDTVNVPFPALLEVISPQLAPSPHGHKDLLTSLDVVLTTVMAHVKSQIDLSF